MGNHRVQVESITPVLRKLLPESTLRGRITSIATLDWREDTARAEIKLMGHECTFQSPNILSGETLAMQQGNLELQATKRGSVLEVEKLRFGSDLAEFDLTATGYRGSPSTRGGTETLPLIFEALQAKGKLDLARIAAQLPVALRLRKGTQIESGQLEFSVDLASAENGRRWEADLAASQLSATAEGRKLQWERPISIRLKIDQKDLGDWTGNVICRSDYLAIQATGSPQAGTLAVKADLTQLAKDLQPIVDLDGIEMAGRIQASVDLARKDSQRIDIDGQGIIEDFDLRFSEGKRFSEERMTLRLQAQAGLQNNKLVALDGANFRINSAGDHAQLKLVAPITLAHLLAGLPLQIRAGGDLASWYDRASLQELFPAGRPEGSFDAELDGRFSASDIHLDRGQLKVKNLKLPLESGVLKQPDLVLTGSGRWQRLHNRLTDLAIGIRAPAFAIWTEKMNVQIPESGGDASDVQNFPLADGTLFLRGDLAALTPLLLANGNAASFSVTGNAEGKFQFQSQGEAITLTPQLAIRQFSLQRSHPDEARITSRGSTAPVQPTSLTPIWRDQELTLDGRLIYDHAQDQIHLEGLAAGSSALGVSELTGTVERLSQRPVANFQGELRYDLAEVTRFLNSGGFDDQLAMVGKGRRLFFIAGHSRSVGRNLPKQMVIGGTESRRAGDFPGTFFRFLAYGAGRAPSAPSWPRALFAALGSRFPSAVDNYVLFLSFVSTVVQPCYF